MRLSGFFIIVVVVFISLGATANTDTPERLEMKSKLEKARQDAEAMHKARDWTKADVFLKEANALLSSIDEDLKIALQKEIVGVLIWLNRYDEAKALLQKNLTMAKFDDAVAPELLAKLHFEMGRISGRQGMYAESLASFQKAYVIHKENGLQASPDHLSAIAAVTHLMGNNEKALTIYEELQSLPGLSPVTMLRVMVSKGAIFIELEKYEAALESFQTAKKLSDETNQKAPNLAQNWGYLYVLMGEHQKALVLLKQALAEYQQNHQNVRVSVSQKSIGESYLRLGNLSQAMHYLSQAYLGLRGKGMVKQELELYPIYIEALEASGEFQQALTYYKEFKTLSDETNDLESKKYAQSLQANFDLKLEQERVEQLEKRQALQQRSFESLEAANQATLKLNRVMTLMIALLTLLLISVIAQLVSRRRSTLKLQQKNTQIEALNEQLKQLSFYDSLTQLRNRNYLNQFIPQEISLAKRHAETNSSPRWMVFLLDIDHFKQFNDTYGHIEGDRALKHFAEHLNSCARQSDVVARWGGEEFIWLCRDIDFHQIPEMFERFQYSLRDNQLVIEQKPITLTFSAGVSELLLHDKLDDVWNATIALADAALYVAKHAGRDRWTGYRVKDYKINTGKLDIDAMMEHGGLEQLN